MSWPVLVHCCFHIPLRCFGAMLRLSNLPSLSIHQWPKLYKSHCWKRGTWRHWTHGSYSCRKKKGNGNDMRQFGKNGRNCSAAWRCGSSFAYLWENADPLISSSPSWSAQHVPICSAAPWRTSWNPCWWSNAPCVIKHTSFGPSNGASWSPTSGPRKRSSCAMLFACARLKPQHVLRPTWKRSSWKNGTPICNQKKCQVFTRGKSILFVSLRFMFGLIISWYVWNKRCTWGLFGRLEACF